MKILSVRRVGVNDSFLGVSWRIEVNPGCYDEGELLKKLDLRF
jgi:hypothetical protein